MDAPLSVLLRDGTHAGATTRLALKAEQVSISVAKTPIQIPIPRGEPLLLDLGISRPSITISGIVDNVGGDPSNSDSGFEDMEKLSIGASAQTYYIPYKNFLEEKIVTWVASSIAALQIEIGDATTPTGEGHTGGGIYKVAVQQAQFSVSPATEDRWVYSLQFAAVTRTGISF
tara:strand:- start:97 stop:615 length:519 start_codon:yes stop_codon:yes gene_type:complete